MFNDVHSRTDDRLDLAIHSTTTAVNSPLPITVEEASWVASLYNLGRIPGAFIGGITIEYFGSKRTLTLLGFPALIAWICIILADSVIWLYVSRFLGGISLGMIFTSYPLHLGEICSPTIRGTLVSLTMSGMAMGSLVGNVMGPYMSMAVFSYISFVPNSIAILLLLWIPESPHYFVRINNINKAKKSVIWYNPKADVKVTIGLIQNYIVTTSSLTYMERVREFRLAQNLRAVAIIIVLFLFMQFSGMNSVVYYMQNISTAAGLNIIDPAEFAIICSSIGVVSGWVTVWIADKFKRKHLLIFSSAGIGISMLGIGAHFAFLDSGTEPEKLQWLLIVSSIAFTIFLCSGIITVPSMMLSELFAPEIKTMAAFIASILIGVFAFAATKSYQFLVDSIGEAWFFWLHSILMMICIIFALLILPETKGKSLQEIQTALSGK